MPITFAKILVLVPPFFSSVPSSTEHFREAVLFEVPVVDSVCNINVTRENGTANLMLEKDDLSFES